MKFMKKVILTGVWVILEIFKKKTPKRTWLCAGISPVR